MFTLAHLSDPHVGPLPRTRLRELCNKRVLGYLSWKVRRAAVHVPHVLRALVDDVHEAGADHIVVTGDITNISLPEEFVLAAQWLKTLGSPETVTIVPGNHDAYVGVPWESSLGLWSAYMVGVRKGQERPPASFDDFPFVRVVGDIALVGVSTARPMAPFFATGAAGAAQLDALARVLEDLADRGLHRIVLIHHPPLAASTRARKRLVDGQRFRDVIAHAGAELVLHGHAHRSTFASLSTAAGDVPVVGASSASAGRHAGDDHYARYHLYRIERSHGRWDVEVEVRGLSADGSSFTTEQKLKLPPQPSSTANAGA